MSKTNPGNFFEDFRIGQTIRHATPRTVTVGDAALYTALYGSRFAVQSSDAFAKAIGYRHAPVDDLLVFHVVFGKTVPDISLNAVANLGYAACRFLAPVYPGDTLSSVSEVIGLKENSNRQTGVVYVRSRGFNQHGDVVLDYVRWVMVRKRDPNAAVTTGIFLQPDHFADRPQRCARIDRLQEPATGVAQIGDGVEGDVGHRLAEHDVENEQVVDRRMPVADRMREGVGGLDGEARAVEGGVERDVARRHRARRGVADRLADPKVLEEIARIGLAHVGPAECLVSIE